MFILLGEFSHKGNPSLANHLRRHHWGRMWGRDHPQSINDRELWGFDNGAFSAWKNGTTFDEAKFLRRLGIACKRNADRPYTNIVSAVPDIVAGGLESLRFSMKWRDRLADDYPQMKWHLVVQDGMTEADVVAVIKDYAGLFLGGTNAFKKTANKWCELAHRKGKFFHWGRCHSVKTVQAARRIRADSIDSSTPVIEYGYKTQDGSIRAKAWLRVAAGRDRQMELFT